MLSIRSFAKPSLDLSLYLITHGLTAKNRQDSLFRIRRAVEGGVKCVQIREDFETARLLCEDQSLKDFFREQNVHLIINNHATLAGKVDGIHIGQRDSSYLEMRTLLGKHSIIGITVNSWEDLERAENLDPDYLGVQVFASQVTKPDSKSFCGIEGLKQRRFFSRHRFVAIGGITLKNIKEVCQALRPGDGIAMAGELWRAKDPYSVAQEALALIKSVLGP